MSLMQCDMHVDHNATATCSTYPSDSMVGGFAILRVLNGQDNQVCLFVKGGDGLAFLTQLEAAILVAREHINSLDEAQENASEDRGEGEARAQREAVDERLGAGESGG